jgi:hypothetical protein
MDDTVARIAEHRRLRTEYEESPCSVLPPDRRTGKAERELAKLSRALDDVTWGFVDRPPQTVAGAAALLRYADEYLATGRNWPDNRSYYDAGPDMPWLRALVRAVGTALRDMENAA